MKHEAEIEELRKAGHDAVAVIVEEYKVSYCQSVLELTIRASVEKTT